MLGFPLGILSAAGAGGVAGGAYELISTTVLGSSASSITFSNLGDYSSTYEHLQMRWSYRESRSFPYGEAIIRFNGDSGTNYRDHELRGNGSTVTSSSNPRTGSFIEGTGNSAPAGSFGAGYTDIIDAYNTSKNTVIRSLLGRTQSDPIISLYSTLWNNTASLTELSITPSGGASFLAGTRFSLYGIRG